VLALLLPPPQAQHIAAAVNVGESYKLPTLKHMLASVNTAHSLHTSVSLQSLSGATLALLFPPPQEQHIEEAVKVGESYMLPRLAQATMSVYMAQSSNRAAVSVQVKAMRCPEAHHQNTTTVNTRHLQLRAEDGSA